MEEKLGLGGRGKEERGRRKECFGGEGAGEGERGFYLEIEIDRGFSTVVLGNA